MKPVFQILLCVVAITGSFILMTTAKAKVDYYDIDCPMCCSDEVLDLGQAYDGQHCKCAECRTEFIISE